jgi:Fe-S-cluster containining protein
VTDCSRCGDCCDPVIVTFDPQVYATERLAAAGDEMQDWAKHQYEFFLAHWRSESHYQDVDDPAVTVHRVRCDQFDRDTRTCMAHDDRPQVCSGFPWYGRDPHSDGAKPCRCSLSPRCSFNADVRTMLPIVEVNR